MKQFEEIVSLLIKEDPRVIGYVVDDKKPNRTIYLLITETHVLIVVCNYFTNKKTGKSKWLSYQLEIPKAGIPWIVDTIENKFLKLSHEGGLPKGVFHYEEFVDGEELGVDRAMGLGSNEHRESGYTITTHSRKPEGRSIAKYLSFTDTFLFKHGFFDLLKSVAKKIQAGEL